MMILKKGAKVNLFLHVTGRDKSSYHFLESLVAFAPEIFDEMHVSDNNQYELLLKFKGLEQHIISNNLVSKIAKDFGLYDLKIEITKQIPIEAGLGGGSVDAAMFFEYLLKKQIVKKDENLNNILLKYGADIPVCYHGKACFFTGFGEKISPINNFPEIFILLVNPNIKLATKAIFEKSFHQFDNSIEKLPQTFSGYQELTEFLQGKHNKLMENSPFSGEISAIIALINKQNNCLYASQSGSGPTCFGLFPTREDAQKALQNILTEKPDWWVRESILI